MSDPDPDAPADSAGAGAGAGSPDTAVPPKRQYAIEDERADGSILVRCAGCGLPLKDLPDSHAHPALTDKQKARRERLGIGATDHD